MGYILGGQDRDPSAVHLMVRNERVSRGIILRYYPGFPAFVPPFTESSVRAQRWNLNPNRVHWWKVTDFLKTRQYVARPAPLVTRQGPPLRKIHFLGLVLPGVFWQDLIVVERLSPIDSIMGLLVLY